MSDLTLILNTAEKHVQFAFVDGNDVLCAETWLAQKGGTEILVPALSEACHRMDRSITDVSRIACVAGPGNFTGLRIGLTTAAGLSRALHAKQAGMDYLQCVAANIHGKPGEDILVLTKARSGLAYSAHFLTAADGAPRKIGSTMLVAVNALSDSDIGYASYIIGSAVTIPDFRIGSLQFSTASSTGILAMPSISSLLTCAARINWSMTGYADIAPLYLRDCDAVENLEELVTKQGRTPSIARHELQYLTTKSLES